MKSLVLAFPVFAMLSTAALAGEPAKAVNYGDLNLNSQQDVVTLHDRIVAAANEVCSTEDTKSVAVDTACKRAAANKAFDQIGYRISQRLASID